MRVGDRRELVKAPVTTTQLVQYAGASGDFNRIHYDQRFAREAGLEDVIAHGMLTMGFAAELVGDWAGDRGVVESIGARFLLPVRLGDSVTVEASVKAVSDDGLVTLTLAGRTERGQVLAGDASFRLRDAG